MTPASDEKALKPDLTGHVWANYPRKGSIDARPWTAVDAAGYRNGYKLPGVSVSDADKYTACNPVGYVARNPDNHADQWYIAPDYFAKHYAASAVAEAAGEKLLDLHSYGCVFWSNLGRRLPAIDCNCGKGNARRDAALLGMASASPAEAMRNLFDALADDALDGSLELPASPAEGRWTDDELRALWRDHGGSFHGPNVETGTMREADLLPFLRGLQASREPCPDCAPSPALGEGSNKHRGMYEKYTVTRNDGSERHVGCEYFVLDMTHDKHAKAAILAYANSCKSEYPQLSYDLTICLATLPFGPKP
jgi:hypothetical protein